MNEKQLQDAITKIVSKNFNKVINNANSNIRTGKIVFVNQTEKKARVVIDGSAGSPTGYIRYPLIYSNVRVGDECVVVFTDATLLSGGRILSIYGNNLVFEDLNRRPIFDHESGKLRAEMRKETFIFTSDISVDVNVAFASGFSVAPVVVATETEPGGLFGNFACVIAALDNKGFRLRMKDLDANARTGTGYASWIAIGT